MVALLLGVGAVFELAGIVALGFPDIRPWTLRLSAWLGCRGGRVRNRIRRLIGLEPLVTVHYGASSLELKIAGMHAFGLVGTSETTLEGKVEYLLRRDQAAQERVNALERRLDELEAESPRQLEETRRGMEGHVTAALAAERVAYRPLRVAGTIALALGLLCVTAATLLA